MLEQIKSIKFKKQFAYFALAMLILSIIYILISVYITTLAYKTIINLPEISPKDYGLQYEEIEFQSSDNTELTLRVLRGGLWVAEIPIPYMEKRKARNFMVKKISQNIWDLFRFYRVMKKFPMKETLGIVVFVVKI